MRACIEKGGKKRGQIYFWITKKINLSPFFESKNTANPVDRIAVLSSIFTLTPSIKIAIPTGVRYFCDGIHYPTSRVNASLTFALMARNSAMNSAVCPSANPMPRDSTAFCPGSAGIVLLGFKSISRMQISAFFR